MVFMCPQARRRGRCYSRGDPTFDSIVIIGSANMARIASFFPSPDLCILASVREFKHTIGKLSIFILLFGAL